MKNRFRLSVVAAGILYGCGADPAFRQVSRDASADPAQSTQAKPRSVGDANAAARDNEAPKLGDGPSLPQAAVETPSPNSRNGVTESAPSERGVVENVPNNDESPGNPRGTKEEGRGVREENATRVGVTEGANPISVIVCSQYLEVPASSNPWLAAAPNGAQFGYSGYTDTIDRAPTQSPLLHQSDCISPDKKLVFETQSTAKHFNGSFVQQGEGKVDEIATFVLGAVRGLSGLTAPIDSLVAVFLSDEYAGTETPPATLNFSTASARNFNELSPKLRQVFFIGDGRTDDGHLQKFVVPLGATRLAFGDMDSYEWNNNVGSHKVRVNEALP